MRRFLWIVLFLVSAALLPAAAAAQHLTIEDVRTMALGKGELDHGIWEVWGSDASGQKIEMKVDAESGRDREDAAQRLTARASGAESKFIPTPSCLSINLFFAAIPAYIERAGVSRIWR